MEGRTRQCERGQVIGMSDLTLSACMLRTPGRTDLLDNVFQDLNG
jgi:hypothetical protein